MPRLFDDQAPGLRSIRDCSALRRGTNRDRVYGTVVTRRLLAMGIRDKPTAPASPWQNGFAERLIGSIRRECLDHIIVLGEAICAAFCEPMLATTTTSERIGHWIKMRRFLARFRGSGTSIDTPSLADFIATTSGCRFSVHTPAPQGHCCRTPSPAETPDGGQTSKLRQHLGSQCERGASRQGTF